MANNNIAWATNPVNSIQVAKNDVTINSGNNLSRTSVHHGYYAASNWP
ncbi:hypothetical protein [Mucilaginibacter gotjawali]|uniref:Uncharacterized protein n=1 Tax=Mucilaginibacter gotjawali TaxID=1550579 RepID=A0A839SJA8_9SPHI|nr:hypothetical protein [Mucilaginibacter gotjawali]MBB3058421.1 hypothetical protein [Mucilaginibacter gotjawali]